MAWIESHQSLSRHRKTLHMVAALKIDRHKILGHLHELWWWGLDNADVNGLVGHVSAEVIAEASGWPARDAERWLKALIEAGGNQSVGFLEQQEGGFVLHDWYEFAGKLNDRREANRERMQRARAGHGPNQDPTPRGTRAQHVNGTSSARAPATGPNQTGPNQTNTSVSDETVSASVDTSAGDDRVDEVYGYFKARVQPRSRLCPRKKIAARLKRFSLPELKQGIDHFADDPWWMEHNADKGAEWFFESDARSEQFLLMRPRAPKNVLPITRATVDGFTREQAEATFAHLVDAS